MAQTSSNQQYEALTGIVTISQANPLLNGQGPMGVVLAAGNNGTIIKSITIKAQQANNQGVIRLFIKNGQEITLWREIVIDANTPSSVVAAYQTTIRPNFALQPKDILLASTQNAETWNIIAQGISWTNCDCD